MTKCLRPTPKFSTSWSSLPAAPAASKLRMLGYRRDAKRGYTPSLVRFL